MQASPLFLFFATADPASAASTQSGWVTKVLWEFGRSQMTGFIFDVLKWTLLGAVVGVIVAVLACIIFSRLGWYHLEWRFARGLRWTIFTVTVVLSAILFSLIGFWSGAIAGTERVLLKSQLATEVFPKVGEVIADGMAWVQIRASSANNTNQELKLEEFRAGKWELHAGNFLQQLDDLKSDSITNALVWLEQSALENTPQLKGGLGEKILHETLNGLGRVLVEKKVASELNNYGVDRIYFAVREQLKNEAGKSGHPQTIGRAEISVFLIRDGIVPGILKPVRSTARSQQLPLLGIALMALIVPPLCIRLARGRFAGATQMQPPPPPPIQPHGP
ncbi:MAG TPA: hypothetical protein VFZ59_19295 [Verrucomicrobiae bacterium]|nr:hypothetical protein [Verrucomicrobiae bacterium]